VSVQGEVSKEGKRIKALEHHAKLLGSAPINHKEKQSDADLFG